MKIAYFDCFSGVSGDMLLGALIDAGLDIKKLKRELNKLNIPYKLNITEVKRANITGTKIDIIGKTNPQLPVPNRDGSGKLSRNLIKTIKESKLDKEIKDVASKMLNRLAMVEAKIHNEPLNSIHFHELSGIDTVIDVVGVIAGLKIMGIEEIYASAIPVGKGFIKCEHGILPVPAPATIELLKGVPVYGKDIDVELTTPTGAVIITSVAKAFNQFPLMEIEKIGYGAGSRKLTIPNMLRVFIGEAVGTDYNLSLPEDMVTVIETNIDNMNPELYDYVMDKLFQKGALDVFLTPVQMKKNRPGIVLNVLADININEIIDVIFKETTTLGVRTYEVRRFKLEREELSVETKYGKVRVKISKIGNKIKDIIPEYEDCAGIAKKLNIPLKEVYSEIQGTKLT